MIKPRTWDGCEFLAEFHSRGPEPLDDAAPLPAAAVGAPDGIGAGVKTPAVDLEPLDLGFGCKERKAESTPLEATF
jgi:hypothetical protein